MTAPVPPTPSAPPAVRPPDARGGIWIQTGSGDASASTHVEDLDNPARLALGLPELPDPAPVPDPSADPSADPSSPEEE